MPALRSPSGRVSWVRSECANARAPIVRSVEGIVTVETCASSNALSSMALVPSGIR